MDTRIDDERLRGDDLRDIWIGLSADERLDGFGLLAKSDAEDFFLALPARDMDEVVLGLPPDDVARRGPRSHPSTVGVAKPSCRVCRDAPLGLRP